MYTTPGSRPTAATGIGWWRLTFILLLLAGYATQGHKAVRVWKSDLTLWTNAVQFAPDSFRSQMNLCKALYGAGRESEALIHFQLAVDIEERQQSRLP